MPGRGFSLVLLLPVPRINDARQDFEELFRLGDAAISSPDDHVEFEFSGCRFIRHNGVVFLGAVARYLEDQGKIVRFDVGSLRYDVRQNLEKNGFASHFGFGSGPRPSNAIPYREDHDDPGTEEHIMDYLRDAWLAPGWVHISDQLKNAIRGRVWEIYANSFEHGGSPLGVFTCGQHYPRRAELSLCVVDLGVGIPHRVRSFLKRPLLPAIDALRWAFRPGNSTRERAGISRGLGLDILSEFVMKNDGHLDVYSDGGVARVTRAGLSFLRHEARFRGTLVDIRFRCDEKLYRLASESGDHDPLF